MLKLKLWMDLSHSKK